MKILKSELILKVSILSMVAFIIMGFVLSETISRHVANDAVNGKVETIIFAIDSAVAYSKNQNNHEKDKDAKGEIQLLPYLQASLMMSGATDFIIWDGQGNEVIRRMPASTFSYTGPNMTYSNKTPGSIVSHTVLPENSQNGNKVLRIDAIAFAASSDETYFVSTLFPYSDIQMHQKMLNRNIAAAIGGGLFLLYLLLVRVLMKTSWTLIQQKGKLDVKNQELETAYKRLNVSFNATVHALADAVDARDPYTAGHVDRVKAYSLAIGKEIGYSGKALKNLVLAAQLHDIGKIGIPDAILLKPGKLSSEEYDVIKKHPAIGTSILKNVPDLQAILPGILHHHERYDGKGYPYQLDDGKIPEIAKIIAVADSYDAMTTNRPYRFAMTREEAREELIRNRCLQFDPDVVDAFIRTFGYE